MAGARGSKDRGDHNGDKNNGGASPVGTVLEMARALSEGNLDCQLTRDLQGELGALAGYIESLRQRLKGVSSVADTSSYLIPQASMGVAGISLQAEEGINSILGLVEEVLGDQERVLEIVRTAKTNGAAPDVAVFETIAEKSRRNLMSLMSQLSFQDVIRQRAEGVQETLEAVEKRIVELLIKFKVGLASETLKEVDGRDRVREEVKNMTDDIGLDQSLVDELLDNIK